MRYDFEFPSKLDPTLVFLHLMFPLSDLGLEALRAFNSESKVVIEDFVLRALEPYILEKHNSYLNKNKAETNTGAIYIHHPGQEMLKRSCVNISNSNELIIMLKTVLPIHSNGGINGKKASSILAKDIPELISRFAKNFDLINCRLWLRVKDTQQRIRKFIRDNGYICFIANGSILPRSDGSNMPLASAIPFRSSPEDEVEIPVGNSTVKGMAIRKGVTVITGGGYSGKSTMLDAIEHGIYNHIPGDGREFVITDETAVKVYAEDGRSISSLDLSPFIKSLALDGNSSNFTTHHASGSTSQAANIIEFINAGSRVLLIDEDKSATNFMIRDEHMKQIVRNDPIIPFTDRVNELFNEMGVSTILVIGGSSEYFRVANSVLLIEDYLPHNADQRIAAMLSKRSPKDTLKPASWQSPRFLSFSHQSMLEQLKTSTMEVTGREYISISDEVIDITLLSAITSKAQANSLAQMLRYIRTTLTQTETFNSVVERTFAKVQTEGLGAVCASTTDKWLEMPRPIELFAILCRLRNANIASAPLSHMPTAPPVIPVFSLILEEQQVTR